MSDRVPLILLPGLLCDAALWAHQIDHLSDIADVHVADLSGFDTMAALAKSVLDKAPPTFAVAGLSMGGYVALEIIRQAPERVCHLALLDTNASADLPEQSERRLKLIKIAESGGLGMVAQQMLPALVHPDHVEEPDIVITFLKMAEQVGVAGFVNQQKAILNRVDSTQSLSAIRCPTLIVCGAEDQLSSVDVHKKMAENIGDNALFVSIANCGHLSSIEQPNAVSTVLRAWLLGD